MQVRRLTRLTSGLSKRRKNPRVVLAPDICWYNFGRVHRSLRLTPMMEAGTTDHFWTWEEPLRV